MSAKRAKVEAPELAAGSVLEHGRVRVRNARGSRGAVRSEPWFRTRRDAFSVRVCLAAILSGFSSFRAHLAASRAEYLLSMTSRSTDQREDLPGKFAFFR